MNTNSLDRLLLIASVLMVSVSCERAEVVSQVETTRPATATENLSEINIQLSADKKNDSPPPKSDEQVSVPVATETTSLAVFEQRILPIFQS
ncbi:MAG TPA: hypothetical protein VLA12_09140, partial [Planctomycetaceae bacterium]|nr:hypothetical protein [Planctomycetaceae bacterium]